MSAIDNTFHFVRNPTAINGLATTYVSKRGSDTTGDGTAQNPYASIAKATAMATSDTNIMLDDGEWNEDRTNNATGFYWWGNAKSILGQNFSIDFRNNRDKFYFLYLLGCGSRGATHDKNCLVVVENCFLQNISFGGDNGSCYKAKDSILINTPVATGTWSNSKNQLYEHCILINANCTNGSIVKNSIIVSGNLGGLVGSTNNNYTSNSIPQNALNSINNAITGQTFADYFNKYDASDWLKCDLTAKEGSANIGAGEKGTTIGFNQGFTMYADNSAGDVFSPSNGATLKNIAWDSTLNGYTLVQKERVCQGATSTTITLDSSASAVDDYYNNLFVGIVGGDGYGELFLINDYDGTTKTATIDGTWNTTPTTNSIYTISGTILSAVKDLGKAIKVKRNWTFVDNFTALTDGQWAEFMTHVEANGKQFSVNCYSYEYSMDGVNFVQGQTADDLVSAINGENKVTDNIYGDCSPNYDEATAKNLIMRYIRVRIHIGFNIGQIGE